MSGTSRRRFLTLSARPVARQPQRYLAPDAASAAGHQQVIVELGVHGLLHRGFHLGGHQLVLGLGGELGVRHLDRDNRGEALPGVVSGGVDLGFLCQSFLFYVGVQAAGEGGPEARQMRPAIPLGNVVGVTEDILLEGIVPLQGDLHPDTLVSVILEVKRAIDG